MGKFFRNFFVSALFWSIFLLLVLSAWQLKVLGQQNYLGQQMGVNPSALFDLYPNVVTQHIAKIFLFNLVWLYFFVEVLRGILTLSISVLLRIFLSLSLVLSMVFIGMSVVIHHPAMFENYFSFSTANKILHLAQTMSPTQLTMMGFTLFFVLMLLANIGIIRKGVYAGAILFAFTTTQTYQTYSANRMSTDNKSPHVVFIAIDSMRLDRSKDPQIMPNLTQLAADAQTVSFSRNYIGVPRTFPSWLEILQGKYAPSTGIRHMFPSLPAREEQKQGMITFAKELGYQTSIISDFAGDIFPRFQAGFDHVVTPDLKVSAMIKLGINQMFPLFLPFMAHMPNTFLELQENPAFSDPFALRHNAQKMFDNTGSQFVTMFFSTAHFPYAAPYPYYINPQKDLETKFLFQKIPALDGVEDLSDADIKQIRFLYDASLKAIDHEIGQLVGFLKASGVWDQTLFVVTADHGEDLYENQNLQGHGEHLRGSHVLNVPLLIKLPQNFQPQQRQIDFVTRSIDIAPTVVSILDPKTNRMDAFDGTSILPWIVNNNQPAPELTAYSETGIWFSRQGKGFFQENRIDYPGISGLLSFDPGKTDDVILNRKYDSVINSAKHRSIITTTYKLIYMPTHDGVRVELYDQVKDPENLNDISQQMYWITSKMRKQILSMSKDMEPRAQIIEEYVLPR
jgi:arylsulfatase A-like enzyme